MHRRHSQNCDECTTADGNNTPNTHRRTSSHVPNNQGVRSVRLIPSLPHKNNPVAKPNQPTRAVTIPRADNWLRNQLTCLVLLTHVHVVARPLSRRVGGAVVCTSRCALPPAVSPSGRAPCSVALPLLAGCSSIRGMRGSVGCRVRNRLVEWRVKQASTRHAADATPINHTAPNRGKQNHTNAERNNEQGTSALLSSPM